MVFRAATVHGILVKQKTRSGWEPHRAPKPNHFIKQTGWTVVGINGTDETKFEMAFEDWQRIAHEVKVKI